MLREIVLFANHATTGSIYYSPWINLSGAEAANLYVMAGATSSAGESYSVYAHFSPDGVTYDNYSRFIAWGAGGGTISSASWQKIAIASATTKTMYVYNLDDVKAVKYFRTLYEVSGVAGSAGIQSTISAKLLIKERSTNI